MKNLKQLVLPCYKLEMVMTVEAWYFLHGSTDGVFNLIFFLSLLSKMTVSEVQNTKRGLSYALHPGQVDNSMLVLAKEWGIGRKAVSRLLEDFSERGLIRVESNPMTTIIDMVCVRSWMIAGRLIENPTYHQTVKAYEGVRIFLFNGQRLETLRRSSSRKKKEKATEGADNLPPMNPADSNPIVEDIEAAKATTVTLPESAVSAIGNTPILENGNE
ncbi:MarR family transcriptional regulator [Phocaeicola vulgatus]|uniref:MarR family transcriptional regulator n=1 Tax=Phocaeicola vulgatus TaxID=821 RepID=UPI0034A5247E